MRSNMLFAHHVITGVCSAANWVFKDFEADTAGEGVPGEDLVLKSNVVALNW